MTSEPPATADEISLPLSTEPGSSHPVLPWWKLHFVTWIAIAFIGTSFAIINMIGVLDSPLWLVRDFGWPLVFHSKNVFKLRPDSPWPNGTARRSVDFLVAVCVTGGAAFAVERRRWKSRIPNFSIATLLASTAALACFVAVNRRRFYDFDFAAKLVSQLAIAGIYIGVFLAWLALFDLLAITWNRLTKE